MIEYTDFKDFMELRAEVKPYTVISPQSCFILWQLALSTNSLSGEVAEVGVYKGGSTRLIAKALPEKTIHAFDTFTGIPYSDADKDSHRVGDFDDTSLKKVKDYLCDCPNVVFHPGIFPDRSIHFSTYCFVHVDVDIYRSTRNCLEFFYPQMVEHGILICDDYGFSSCPGAKLAFDEFFEDKEEKIVYLLTGQAFVSKL